jgi:deazaflavin-dependent oxidoreductase (nitroreductase family)
VIASGFAGKAQWFRNIQANPRVRVYIGSRAPAPATARILAQPEADHALDAYISRRPRYWERFKPVLEKTLGSPITETNTPLPIVELRLG